MDEAREVVEAQLALARALPPERPVLDRLLTARTPDEVLAAVEVAPLDRGLFAPLGDSPARLRARHAGTLGLTPADLAFRGLYPGLDVGIYACSHSMGVPSVAGPAAVVDQLAQLARNGIGVWDDGTWPAVMDAYRARCAELVGGDLERGDVTWFPNVSEALAAVLESIDGGTLVFTSGHFTTGHHVHHQWARNTGGRLREIPVDADGGVPTERVVAALDADVRVVSVSHALFESGWLQDLPAIVAAVAERCPHALVLVDAYQTAGTVPIDANALGDRVAVTAGGHKQLRSSAGAAFLYVPRRWLAELEPRRAGWWGHADPFRFEKGAVRRAPDGTRFRTGTPTLAGMAMLLGELAALASSTGGSLDLAVQRARAVTSGLVERTITRAREQGLVVRGGWDVSRRAAFCCVEHPRGRAAVEHLGREGYRLDFRPDTPGSDDGIVRVGANAAGFAYEVDAVVDALARTAG